MPEWSQKDERRSFLGGRCGNRVFRTMPTVLRNFREPVSQR
jgi:hypothetical protein